MVVNARDAMAGNGHLTIQVATAAWLPSVRAHPGRVADYVTIALSDTGSGIAPDKLDAIFEPFYTTKPSGAGLGLGLAICRDLAAEFGGDLQAHNHADGGACFVLTVPVGPAPDTAKDTPSR